MADKEKLTNVIYSMDICSWDWAGKIADHLISNGITFQAPIVPGHDNQYNIAEMAYDNGYAKGVEDGKPKWIPVSERLPNNCKEHLCVCNIDGHTEYPFIMVLRYYLVDEKPHFQHESNHGLRVTHWMPLPEPPKEDS